LYPGTGTKIFFQGKRILDAQIGRLYRKHKLRCICPAHAYGVMRQFSIKITIFAAITIKRKKDVKQQGITHWHTGF
jgi:hypothetical protein